MGWVHSSRDHRAVEFGAPGADGGILRFVNIYMDNNATTEVVAPVREAMLPLLTEDYANPSAPYASASRVLAVVERSRRAVASLIGATPGEILFTSGGTESNNTVLRMMATKLGAPRILVSAVEHPAIAEEAEALEATGARVGKVPVFKDGSIDVSCYKSMLNDGYDLVSLMTANNETGVIFPIAELAELAHRSGALFHTDAVQAAGKVPIDVRETGVDYLSLAAHKLHGPKGVGALYIKEGAAFEPLLRGGGQERHLRASTLNTPGIAGFGCAAGLARQALDDMNDRIRCLRDGLETVLQKEVHGVTVIGAGAERLPNTCYLSFEGIDAEALLARLDLAGVSCSAGSACMAGSPEPSPVLTAMGLSEDCARGAIRLSLSRLTNAGEIAELLRILPEEVAALRALK